MPRYKRSMAFHGESNPDPCEMQSLATYTALVLMLLSDAQAVTKAPGKANCGRCGKFQTANCGKLMQAAGIVSFFNVSIKVFVFLVKF